MLTPSQNKQLHGLLSATGLMPRKAVLIESFTRGRTQSSKDLNHYEYLDLMQHLNKELNAMNAKSFEKADKMRKKIISYAIQMNWTLPTSTGIKCDMARLNAWCLKSSYLHKPLNSYQYQELPKLVTQFEQVYNSYLNSI